MDGRIRGINTTSGDIKTDIVVSAVGIWAPKIGGLAGVPIPLSPMQHIYAITKPIEELEGVDSKTYLSHSSATKIVPCTSGRNEKVSESARIYTNLWSSKPTKSLTLESAPIAPAEMPFTSRHFEAALEAASDVMPSLKGIELTRKFNGLFSFTTDSFPILGEAPQVNGFWSAQAVWITHAGGIGKAVAEWIVNGEPTIDLGQCDIARFHPHAYSRSYVRARASQQYREVYDIIHPMQQISDPRSLRVSPFFARQQELGAVFFEDGGWEKPRWYDTNEHLLGSLTAAGTERQGWEAREWSPNVAAEHVATRERVSVFDLTAFAQFEITGTGSL